MDNGVGRVSCAVQSLLQIQLLQVKVDIHQYSMYSLYTLLHFLLLLDGKLVEVS